MSFSISHITLVPSENHTSARELAQSIARWLHHRGLNTRILPTSKDNLIPPETWQDTDMIITFGGDGTLLGIARATLDLGIPLLGLNLGHVGFLTELSPEDWQENLTQILDGRLAISSRLAITFRVERDGVTRCTGYAINDLVISCGSLARMTRVNMWYGADHLGSVRADGMIISTPTGSSGYSISAGGPLIYPELDVFTLTPICPFLHAFRPMVLPFEEEVRLQVQDAESDVYLTQDGQTGIILAPGDMIYGARAFNRLHLVRPLHSQYAHKLKSKGFIRES